MSWIAENKLFIWEANMRAFILGEEEKIAIKFDDPRVCKSFLLGCCPHEILASTVRLSFNWIFSYPKVHRVRFVG